MPAGRALLILLRSGAIAGGLLSLGACRSLPAETPPASAGSVDVALLLPPPGAARLALDANQGFAFPDLLPPVAMPQYPAELLALRLPPLRLCVEVDIAEDGRVFAARRRVDAACPDAAGAHDQRFTGGALAAAMQWRFSPAALCTMPDARVVSDPCAEAQAHRRPTALRLSYAFLFSQQDGLPAVDVSATDAR